MKPNTKFSIAILFFLLIGSVAAQDLIYTVSGELASEKVSLDSILFENVTNGTRLLFENLPDKRDYIINLTAKEFQGSTGIDNFQFDNSFKLIKNTPGIISIACTQSPAGKVMLSVFNIQGQKLYSISPLTLRAGNSINVELANVGIYFVQIVSSRGSKTYKAIGSMNYSSIQAYITGEHLTDESSLKSSITIFESDFSFELGDSLRVSIYKDGYYTSPQSFLIENSKPLEYIFDVSSVNIYGISDAYLMLSETDQASMTYDIITGVVQLTPSSDTVIINMGDIITIDADSTGYLRKVVSILEDDGTINMVTEQAYLNDVFVDIDFKLNTEFREPKPNLKSTSTFSEITDALTDEKGYIHPVEIIYYDKLGKLLKKSVLTNAGFKDGSINIIDFFNDLSETDIYGKEGDNIHFYIDEGHISLKSDAVFEFDFDYEGELSEDTKVKKGDLKMFKFYLDSRAEFMNKYALDMNYSYEKEATKKLLDFETRTAKFLVSGIPVWITFDVDVFGNYHLKADASLHADWGFESNHDLQVGGLYQKDTDSFTPIKEYTPENIIYPLNINGEVNALARF